MESEKENLTTDQQKDSKKDFREKFWRWRQRLKCRFGWHRPRVWGHTEEDNDTFEYYYDCEVCQEDGFWAPPMELREEDWETVKFEIGEITHND